MLLVLVAKLIAAGLLAAVCPCDYSGARALERRHAGASREQRRRWVEHVLDTTRRCGDAGWLSEQGGEYDTEVQLVSGVADGGSLRLAGKKKKK